MTRSEVVTNGNARQQAAGTYRSWQWAICLLQTLPLMKHYYYLFFTSSPSPSLEGRNGTSVPRQWKEHAAKSATHTQTRSELRNRLKPQKARETSLPRPLEWSLWPRLSPHHPIIIIHHPPPPTAVVEHTKLNPCIPHHRSQFCHQHPTSACSIWRNKIIVKKHQYFQK